MTLPARDTLATLAASAVAVLVAAILLVVGLPVATPTTHAAERPVAPTLPAHQPTVTETPEPLPLVAPMVLNIDALINPGWQVHEAAEIWNNLLGCEVFTLAPSGDAEQVIYWVTETANVTTADGTPVWALHTPPDADRQARIAFDPSNPVEPFVAVHELGHALGLSHGDGAGSVMNVHNPDRHLPSDADIADALASQVLAGRCPA